MAEHSAEELEAEALPYLDAVLADGPPAEPSRPRTIGVMVTSANGWAAVDGGSGGLTNGADRGVFRGLRGRADALLVGSGTLNAERYSTVLDPHQRERRVAAGRTPEPTVATVTPRMRLHDDLPILETPENELLVYTDADADCSVVRAASHAEGVSLDPATHAAALADLAARGAAVVNCEGGPSTLGLLVRHELLDDLVLTISPLLVSGPSPITAVVGDLGADVVALDLRRTWRQNDVVFLHYRVGSRA